jgi:exosome complex component RRP41
VSTVSVSVPSSPSSTICTMQNAITLALMDAGVAMSDMVVACSSGFVKQQPCVDLTQLEQSSGVYLPMAVKARSEEVLYVQLDSRLSQGALREALQRGMAACKELRALFEDAVKLHMARPPLSSS